MKVLVPMDTSSTSQAVLEEIAARPWPTGSSFEILSVVEPYHVPATVEGVRDAVHCVNKVVESAIECLRLRGWETTGGVIADDDPKLVIIDCARRMNADFVIVGSHGKSDLDRFLLGSVAAAVVRYAPCSVEIVRAKIGAEGGPRPMKVLLATDGSKGSELAASSIAKRPWPEGTEIRVLSVAEVHLSAMRALLELSFLGSAIASARAEGIKRSHDAIAAARKMMPGATAAVSKSDDPKRAILAEAAEWEADLVILGTHGRRGMDRFQLGSVSEAVALHARCSVEITREHIGNRE